MVPKPKTEEAIMGDQIEIQDYIAVSTVYRLVVDEGVGLT